MNCQTVLKRLVDLGWNKNLADWQRQAEMVLETKKGLCHFKLNLHFKQLSGQNRNNIILENKGEKKKHLAGVYNPQYFLWNTWGICHITAEEAQSASLSGDRLIASDESLPSL